MYTRYVWTGSCFFDKIGGVRGSSPVEAVCRALVVATSGTILVEESDVGGLLFL